MTDIRSLKLHWETTARQGEPLGSGHVYVVMEGGKKLASVWGSPALKEKAADLFAAAPELLKLLQEVLEWNEDDSDLATNDTAFRLKNFADTVSNRSAALKAAIAKATGAA